MGFEKKLNSVLKAATEGQEVPDNKIELGAMLQLAQLNAQARSFDLQFFDLSVKLLAQLDKSSAEGKKVLNFLLNNYYPPEKSHENNNGQVPSSGPVEGVGGENDGDESEGIDDNSDNGA